MTTRLVGDEGGRWCIGTVSGAVYRLDLDRRTLSRGTGEPPDSHALPAVELRRDAEVLPLLGLLRPVTVGASMIVLIEVRGDGVPTLRESTPVRSIVRLDTDMVPGDARESPRVDFAGVSFGPSGAADGRPDGVRMPAWARDSVAPGVLDLRVLDQADVWVTRDGTVLPVAHLSTAHLRAVIEMLTERVGELALGGLMHALFEVVAADLADEVSGERLVWELTGAPSVADTPVAWLECTALMRALRRELAAREQA